MLWFFLYSAAALLAAIAYTVFIRLALQHWMAIPAVDAALPAEPPFVSVLVPGRNEAAHLPECLGALLQQDYPPDRYEILFIDDHSTDDSLAVARQLQGPQLRILELQQALDDSDTAQAYKKKALELGVREAWGNLLLTTDADCRAPQQWIRTMAAALLQYDWQAIAGPVLGWREKNFLQRFQSLDFAGMMLMTAAGLHSGQFTLGNGASLGFRRAAFEAVGGYAGNKQYASGDDVFLLRKIAQRFPGQLGFLKDAAATVHTAMKPDWQSFLRQRLRWGTKNRRAASGGGATAALGVAFLLSWLVLLTPFLLPFAGAPALILAAVLLALKAAADYLLLRQRFAFSAVASCCAVFSPWSWCISCTLHSQACCPCWCAGMCGRGGGCGERL